MSEQELLDKLNTIRNTPFDENGHLISITVKINQIHEINSQLKELYDE